MEYNLESYNIPVIFVTDVYYEFFEHGFHFKAMQINENTYEIIDWLGRNATEKISTAFYEKYFRTITDEEFEEYERYINQGDTSL